MGASLCFDLWAAQHLTCNWVQETSSMPSFHLPSVTAPGGWTSLGHSHAPQHPDHHSSQGTAATRSAWTFLRPASSECLRSSASLQATASEHQTGADTEKLVLAAKGLTGVLLSCFVFFKKKLHFTRETYWSIYGGNDTESGVSIRICQQRNEEGGKGRETRGCGDGRGMKWKWQNVHNPVI